jgi:hypothetical protein
MAAGSQTLSAQNIQVPKAYMFGFVASFNDSTVYFTDIQEIDSIWVTKKKQYIAGKSNYSYQLRNFFAQQRNLPNRTCVIMGSVKRKDVEKKYAKMKQNYLVKNKGKFDVRYLPESEFRFKVVDMSDENDPAPVEKKKEKKQKKDGKRPPRDGKMPPPPPKK